MLQGTPVQDSLGGMRKSGTPSVYISLPWYLAAYFSGTPQSLAWGRPLEAVRVSAE